MPIPVILDVDTGSDDAVALMAAVLSPDIDLLAVCTVAGNQPVTCTTDNTLRILDAMNCAVPVYAGCPAPLMKHLADNRIPSSLPPVVVIDGEEVSMHTATLNLPPPTTLPQDEPAVCFYLRHLRMAEKPVTIVALGPLTNLAVALTIAPELTEKIDRFIIMGGGFAVTNRSPAAEFNFWADPEAAQRVLHCGAEILLVPLDATHQAYLTAEDCQTLRRLDTFAATFTAELVEHRIRVQCALEPLANTDAAAVHDAVALLAVLDESVLADVRPCHCDIGLGGFAEGATILSRSPRYDTGADWNNIRFAFGGNRSRFVAMLIQILGTPHPSETVQNNWGTTQ